MLQSKSKPSAQANASKLEGLPYRLEVFFSFINNHKINKYVLWTHIDNPHRYVFMVWIMLINARISSCIQWWQENADNIPDCPHDPP